MKRSKFTVFKGTVAWVGSRKPAKRDPRDIEGASGGTCAKDLCRKHGVSDGTFYKWRAKFGGMEVSDARKQKATNSTHKKLVAEQMMNVSTLKDMWTCCAFVPPQVLV
ncbi:transposase [Rhodobacteraceae bacterium]|nr:transposase [Paracoccaceae bacterium]